MEMWETAVVFTLECDTVPPPGLFPSLKEFDHWNLQAIGLFLVSIARISLVILSCRHTFQHTQRKPSGGPLQDLAKNRTITF